MTALPTLDDCRRRDAADPLRPLRDLFQLPEGVVYLDGNSLGALPKATPDRVAQVVRAEWGTELIRAWNTAGWADAPRRIGDRIARLVGAGPGELVATDSTSVNLYKVLSAALAIAAEDAPDRRTIVSERSNFPTDLYIAESLARERGGTLRLVEAADLPAAVDGDTAVLLLTHVHYRTGAMHDMAAVTAAAHAAGALVVWDLAHSAGAVPVDLHAANADFAIGCGYKFLNGGPGAPAFVWVHPRHVDRFRQPLSGWWGHAQPFAFVPGYQPAAGIGRYLCGTQPQIALAALEAGLDVFAAAEPLGGMAALRAKSLALTDLFIALVDARCDGHPLGLATPRDPARRGSQVSLTWHGDAPEAAHAIVQALIDRGVIGDYRAGDGCAEPHILRFGFTPLYTGFEDVWQAVEQLRDVLATGAWRDARFHRQAAVT